MPQAPRTTGLRTPGVRGFRNPLRLSPIRSDRSLALDRRVSADGQTIGRAAPDVRWDRFLEQFIWRQGEHLTVIAPTGSGKTVLVRQLLPRREYVLILGVKNRDPELYGPFERAGYQLVSRFDPEPEDGDTHILLVPRTSQHGAEARAFKSEVFRDALNEVYDAGGWTVYADDVQYQSDKLRLGPEFEELLMLGRSEDVTVVGASQEPVDIPLMFYGMATHLFLGQNTDLVRARRMAELTGINRRVTEEVIMGLDKHEFLYVNKATGQMLRTKVQLTRPGRS